MAERWRVSYEEHGRDGYVHYRESGRTLSFYWEFGGGEVVVFVAVGDAGEWRKLYPELADRRDEIIARIAGELIRQRMPTCRWRLDGTGRLLEFIVRKDAQSPHPAKPSPQPKAAEAAAFFWRLNEVKSRMSAIVLILILLAVGAMLAGRSVLTVKTTGTPAGASARAGDFIATPISRLEPYIPSLDRNHGKDRYSIGLLLHSTIDQGARRYVRVAEGKTGSDSVNVRISGVAGDVVWFDAPETSVIDARAARVLTGEAARRAPEPPRPRGAEALTRLATSDRRLEALLAEPGEDGAPAQIQAGAEIFNAALVRAAPYGRLLQFDDGDFLAVYWTKRYREGLMIAARIDVAGATRWKVETALGSLDEALPDAARPAFVGARPRIEGKVAEPLLVVIDAATGKAATHSLLVD